MSQRIQLSLGFDDHAELLSAVKEHCRCQGITLKEFTALALSTTLDSELTPKKFSEEIINRRFDELERSIASIKNIVLSQKRPKKKIPQRGSVNPIGILKGLGIFDKTVKPDDSDIDRIFVGADGSQWCYLGIRKSSTSGVQQKQFQRV